jgi:hypothetical protein
MNIKIKMEDGSWGDVADWSDEVVHQWGDIWLVGTITDNIMLFEENGSQMIQFMTMGEFRFAWAGWTGRQTQGGKLFRQRTFSGCDGIDQKAKPFGK